MHKIDTKLQSKFSRLLGQSGFNQLEPASDVLKKIPSHKSYVLTRANQF